MAIDWISQKEYGDCKNRKDGQNPRKQDVETGKVTESKKETKKDGQNRKKTKRM